MTGKIFIKLATSVLFYLADQAGIALAQGSNTAVVASKAGQWKVMRSIDPMTDKTRCDGFYVTDQRIQLSDKALYVAVRGGIKSVTLRFGDKPARSLRLPQETEKRVSAVIIEGADLTEAAITKRLRLQALTQLDSLFSQDLDLTGIEEALQSIRSGCPAVSAPKGNAQLPESRTSCDDSLRNRLKSVGVSPSQIAAACQ